MLFIDILILTSYVLLDYFFAKVHMQYPHAFLIYTLVVFSSCLIGWIAAYNFEYLYRNDFYQQHIISDQANKLKESNLFMEQKVIERTRELEQERMKKLKAILTGQQTERERIARDLHDTLNIGLIVFKRKLELLPDNAALLSEVDKIIQQVREISHDLLPYSLKHFGLIKAVEVFGEDLERQSGLTVTVSAVDLDDTVRWDSVVETELYKIIQELAANTIKHAHARRLLIEFICDKNLLYLTVDDDGAGYDTANEELSRFGLNNIEARINLLGGTVSFDSRPGEGTTVMINIPIS